LIKTINEIIPVKIRAEFWSIFKNFAIGINGPIPICIIFLTISLLLSLNFLKNKAKTLEDIFNNSSYILNDNLKISSEDKSLIDKKSQDIIKNFIEDFEALKDLNKTSLEPIIKNLIDKHKTNFKGVGQPLRIGLVGTKFGPGIYDIILSLDKTTVINRLKKLV